MQQDSEAFHLRPSESQAKFIYSSGMPLIELLARVKSLLQITIILHMPLAENRKAIIHHVNIGEISYAKPVHIPVSVSICLAIL